jgi:hypothetical protein
VMARNECTLLISKLNQPETHLLMKACTKCVAHGSLREAIGVWGATARQLRPRASF